MSQPNDLHRTGSSGTEGTAFVFSFPFRVYAIEALRALEAQNARFRYRLYEPVVLRQESSWINPEFPPNKWPGISVDSGHGGKELSSPPMVDIRLLNDSKFAYDGLRLDIWGASKREEVAEAEPFIRRFLGWVRYATAQPWINSIENQMQNVIQHDFPIDASGRVIGGAGSFRTVHMPFNGTRSADNSMWKAAFQRATANLVVQKYWDVFYEANRAHADDDLSMSTLLLSLSVEIARDFHFERLGFEKKGEFKFHAPFNHDDLLMHLTRDLSKKNGRNLELLHPELYQSLYQVYKGRHSIAHGKPAKYHVQGEGMRDITYKDYGRWAPDIYKILHWLEGLPRTIPY